MLCAGRIAQCRSFSKETEALAEPLPLAPWAHAIGASSVMRSVHGKDAQGSTLTTVLYIQLTSATALGFEFLLLVNFWMRQMTKAPTHDGICVQSAYPQPAWRTSSTWPRGC